MINLGKENSLLNQFIAELRDHEIQQDSLRFRRNMERIGEIFAYEISKKLAYKNLEVVTTLGAAQVPVLEQQVVITSILRSGLPLHNGLLNFFDKAQNGFISAYRKFDKTEKFRVKIEYISAPDINNKVLILADPLLATGNSAVTAYKDLLSYGKPIHTHLVTILASAEGVDYIQKRLTKSEITLWVGAIDDELTAQAYIVPGMGDAGDLAFGSKN